MSNFLSASIGRKVFMSLTGLFLISFLFIHLTLNLFLILTIQATCLTWRPILWPQIPSSGLWNPF